MVVCFCVFVLLLSAAAVCFDCDAFVCDVCVCVCGALVRLMCVCFVCEPMCDVVWCVFVCVCV